MTPEQDGVHEATDLAHAAERDKPVAEALIAVQLVGRRLDDVGEGRAQIISFGISSGGHVSGRQTFISNTSL
jgi:hypothetical protein